MPEPVDEFDTLSPEELARLSGGTFPRQAIAHDTGDAIADLADGNGPAGAFEEPTMAGETVAGETVAGEVFAGEVAPGEMVSEREHDNADIANEAVPVVSPVRQSTFVEAALERRHRRRRSAVIVAIGGFLTLAVLGMTFGKTSIENDIRKSVTKTLANDYRNVKVDVDGNRVSLSGSVATDEDLEEVTELVENTNLVNQVDTKQLVVRASSGIGLLPLRATYNEGSLTLEGTSPGQLATDALLKRARTGLGESKVVDQFTAGTPSDVTADLVAYESLGDAFASFSRLGVRTAAVSVDDRGITLEGRLKDDASRAQLVGLMKRAAGSLAVDDRMTAENSPPPGSETAGTPDTVSATASTTATGSPASTSVTATPETVSAAQADLNELLANQRIEFSTDSAVLSNQAKSIIQKVADVVVPLGINVEVGGHTDGRGKPEKNLALSQRRADAVRVELIRLGVPEARVTAVGYGSEKLVARDDATRGNPKNRRIEITLK